MRFLLLLLFCASTAHADGVTIDFGDGNPFDRFIIGNVGCALEDATIIIDTRGTTGDVLMDTVRGGPGTQDPMPIAIKTGDAQILPTRDGSQLLILKIGYLKSDDRISVTLDVDDGAAAAHIDRVEVAQNEMAGASARLIVHRQSTIGIFGQDGTVLIEAPNTAKSCLIS